MPPPSDAIKGSAILFSEMTPPDGAEDAFNAWYDGHHTPDHVRGVPGFLSAMRYRSPAGPHYLAVYELDGVETLQSAEYRGRKFNPDAETAAMLDAVSGFTRYIAAETFCRACAPGPSAALEAPVLACTFYAVPLERRGAFEDWFDGAHAPLLLDGPGWLMVRRLDIVEWNPEPHTHLVLHYLADGAALESEAPARARATEAYGAMAAEPWFLPLTVVYHRRGKRFRKAP